MLNPRLADLQETLREKLSVHRVDELEEFPFKDYSEFIDAQNEGRVEVLTDDDPESFGALAGPGAKWAISVHGLEPLPCRGRLCAGMVAVQKRVTAAGRAARVHRCCLVRSGVHEIGGPVAEPRFAGRRVLPLWSPGDTNRCSSRRKLSCSELSLPLAASLIRRIFLRAAAESELILVWLFSRGQLVPVTDSPVPARVGRPRSDKALQPSAARVSVERQPFQERPVTNVPSKTPLTLVVGQSSPERPQRNDHRDDRRSDADEHRDLPSGDPTELPRHLGAEGGKLGLWHQGEKTGDVRPKTRDSVVRDVGAISAIR